MTFWARCLQYLIRWPAGKVKTTRAIEWHVPWSKEAYPWERSILTSKWNLWGSILFLLGFLIGYLPNCLHWIEAWQLFLLSFQKALLEPEAVSPSVWIITCNLTQTGQPATIKVDVKMPENYPVDLYYLMDLSGSMVEDLKKFPTLGQQIGTYLYSNSWTSCLI